VKTKNCVFSFLEKVEDKLISLVFPWYLKSSFLFLFSLAMQVISSPFTFSLLRRSPITFFVPKELLLSKTLFLFIMENLILITEINLVVFSKINVLTLLPILLVIIFLVLIEEVLF
jgi:hypothetical protein